MVWRRPAEPAGHKRLAARMPIRAWARLAARKDPAVPAWVWRRYNNSPARNDRRPRECNWPQPTSLHRAPLHREAGRRREATPPAGAAPPGPEAGQEKRAPAGPRHYSNPAIDV